MDIHCNADTACGAERILRTLNNPWNLDTPLIRTLWVGPKGIRIKGVVLYDVILVIEDRLEMSETPHSLNVAT